jgi:hypothetical protein
MASARLRCCERSFWHCTTMPVGTWVMRIAESVLLMCWPPAPEARKVSVRRSAGIDLDLDLSSISGYTYRLAKLVWRPPEESKGDLRTRRCTPVSVRRKP